MQTFTYTIHGRLLRDVGEGQQAGREIILGGSVVAEDQYEAETLAPNDALAAVVREYGPEFRFEPTSVSVHAASDQGWAS